MNVLIPWDMLLYVHVSTLLTKIDNKVQNSACPGVYPFNNNYNTNKIMLRSDKQSKHFDNNNLYVDEALKGTNVFVLQKDRSLKMRK